jgi:hypothetical protein
MRCEQSKSPAKTIESHNAPGAMSNNNISTFDQWHSLSDEICSVPYAAIPSASHTINSSFFPFFHGIPKKSITEIVGLPGTGKTCFA